jgi:hypothetical protein
MDFMERTGNQFFLETFGLVLAESFGSFLSTRFSSSAQHATQKNKLVSGWGAAKPLTQGGGCRESGVTGEFARR